MKAEIGAFRFTTKSPQSDSKPKTPSRPILKPWFEENPRFSLIISLPLNASNTQYLNDSLRMYFIGCI
ncbi:MAG: hypothetical protein EAZ15_05640 [Sphingobacteriales bacterium]|nr:MAG: hypothetical protein EAZ15_05640 [Sphingobacteriales bacterium]